MGTNIRTHVDNINKILYKSNNHQSLKKELKSEWLGIIEKVIERIKNISPENNTQHKEKLTPVSEIIATAEVTGGGEFIVDSLLDMMGHDIKNKSTLTPEWIAPLLYFLFPRTQLNKNKNQQYILHAFLSKLYERNTTAFLTTIADRYKENNIYSLAAASESEPALEVLKSSPLLQDNVVRIAVTLYDISNYPNILTASNQLVEKITDCVNQHGQLSYKEKERLFDIMKSIQCVDSFKKLHAKFLPNVPPRREELIKQLNVLIRCLENKPVQATVSKDSGIIKKPSRPFAVSGACSRYFRDRNHGYQRIENDIPSPSSTSSESETIPLLSHATTASEYCGTPEIQPSPSP